MDPNLPPSDVSDTLRTYRGTQQGQVLQAPHSDAAFPRTRYTTMSFRLVEESSEEEPPSSLKKGYRVYRGGNWVHRQRDARVTDGGQGHPADLSYRFLRGLRLVEED
jgi:hypothetical protein